MARLNEPAAPAESVESVKRRFMRQNRDIARANSTQSLRIRNLENETSRLLAENLGLREQIIRLQNELENGQAQRMADHTSAVKSQLETKLLEIGALLSSLGDEPTKKKSPQPGKITRANLSKSPDQKNWKNMCSLSEAVGGQEGRLPPILENKTYPRRTLERQELLSIISDAVADTTDSPEIGPPPVSQFVDEDPVKIDLPSRPRKVDNQELPDMDPALSVNLEQRRKRKDSIGVSESKRTSKVEPAPNSNTLKIGAKRKLSVRDDEERENPAKQVDESSGDFKFTRGVSEERTRSKSATQPASKSTRELAIARGAPREKQPIASTATSNSRKVLAPKNVNDSPRKNGKVPVQDEVKAAKVEAVKAIPTHGRQREKKQEPISINPLTNIVIESTELQVEPETPAALDIFSPSSQPSTARAESRDTPPPPDLGLGNDGHRPSRRARGAVSYAEPNLRDKMRRPTKELVDAVTVDSKVKRGSIIKLEDDANPESFSLQEKGSRSSIAAVTIKAEPEAEDAWKSMPVASSATIENSPLSGKTSVTDPLPSSITTHRRRRESILHLAESEFARSSSASSIAALLASNRKAKAEAKEKGLEDEKATTKVAGDIDIYEFRGSPTAAEILERVKKDAEARRSTRRHSTISRDIIPNNESETSDVEVMQPDNPLSRRRQSALGTRSSSSATINSVKDEDTEKALRKSISTTNMLDPGSRSDRIAARRRSMML